MNANPFLYIAVMAGVTYIIRALPLTLLRRQIETPFLRSFLYYVPYVALSVMIFPAILWASSNLWAGLAAFVVAVLLAWRRGNLFEVSIGACVTVFVVDMLMK